MLFTVTGHHITVDQKVSLRELRIEQDAAKYYPATAAPRQWHLLETQDGKHKILAPQSCVHTKGSVSRSPDLHLPTHVIH